jgi:hypothetical protein
MQAVTDGLPPGLDHVLDRVRGLRRDAVRGGFRQDAVAYGLALEAVDALVAAFGPEATRTFLLCQEAALRGKVQGPAGNA